MPKSFTGFYVSIARPTSKISTDFDVTRERRHNRDLRVSYYRSPCGAVTGVLNFGVVLLFFVPLQAIDGYIREPLLTSLQRFAITGEL